MFAGGQFEKNADLAGQLFMQLAVQSGFGPFIRLDFAAGEFPQATELLALRPTGNQDSFSAFQNGTHNIHTHAADTACIPRGCNWGRAAPDSARPRRCFWGQPSTG
jgi:hypothetical protein